MSIPETIKRHKPTDFGACEIRFIGGYYYVYPVTSRWDPTKGRSQKVTLKSVGKGMFLGDAYRQGMFFG